MRALITGGHGFVGRHLAQHLVRCGDDVALTYYPIRVEGGVISQPEHDTANQVPLPRTAQSLALDVSDANAVHNVISLLKPDVVYHLAALSSVPQAEADASMTLQVNLMGVKNVLDAIQLHSPESRFLFVSSAEVYGEPRPGALPYTELSELRPASIYGVSKAAADLLVYKYGYRNGLHVVRVRPFPHVGPGQADTFALSSFAKQVAQIKLGLIKPEIKVGNLEVKRDYSDVSDIVRGYREAMLNGKSGEVYNLCSGQSVELKELVRLLVLRAGQEVTITEDPERTRSVDVPDLYGSFDKANKHFGWKPRVEREAMLDGVLSYWQDLLSSK